MLAKTAQTDPMFKRLKILKLTQMIDSSTIQIGSQNM